MSTLMTIKIALRALSANKARSGLTMLGIMIGVAAVVAMVSIGTGAGQTVQNQIQGLGSNLITVSAGAGGPQGGARQALGSAVSLTQKDGEAIKSGVAGVRAISAEYSDRTQIVYRNRNTNASVSGVTPDYEAIRKTTVIAGRFITEEDLRRSERSVVVGQNVVSDLFDSEDPIGKVIKLQNIPFTVVGVLELKGGLGFNSPDDSLFIPLSTAQNRVFGADNVSQISVEILQSEMMDQAQDDIGWLLLRRHGLSDPQEADFRVMNQQDILETAGQVTGIMTTLLGGIGGISLLVGGIGIMNIMLVSVSERTREIGLRKAIGAKRRDILKQFLIESVTLSLIGGLFGIGFGFTGSRLAAAFGMAAVVSPASIALAFFFSATVGIFFGIYPAHRASLLSPIDALRHE